jgi:hypothetical protein
VSDLFFGFVELICNLIEKSTHGLFSVEHVSSLLVAFNVVFNLFLEVFVDPFVLKYTEQALVDLAIQNLVFIGQLQVLLPEVLALEGRLIKLTLARPHRSIKSFEFSRKIFVLVRCVLEGLAELLIFALAFITLSF